MHNNNKFIKVFPELAHLDFNKCDIALSLYIGQIPTNMELEVLKEMIFAVPHDDLKTKRIKVDTSTFEKITELSKFYKLSLQNTFNLIFLWCKDNELLFKDQKAN